MVDTAKAEYVLGKLLNAFLGKTYPYNLPDAVPPQTPQNMPETLILGTREHALFLFCLCYYMRGGIKSHTAAKLLSKLYDNNPLIFLPEKRGSFSPSFVSNALKEVGLGFNADEIGDAWLDNFNRLDVLWGSNPVNIFNGISTYEEACERIQNRGKKKHVVENGFRGFQEKMVSMLTYFLMDAGFIDRWHFPIPIDFHVLRVVFAHEIITSAEPGYNGFYTKEVLAATRQLFLDYCRNHNVDPLRLCDAVWLYSGLMCSLHPGNQSRIEEERKGRKTIVVPMLKWSRRQIRTCNEQACGQCFIRDTCRWCVPSADYYIRGVISLRAERDDPPQIFLFTVLP
jgi:hypothetical protein